MTALWLGIDPGARGTGFALRDLDDLCHWHHVVDAKDLDPDKWIEALQTAIGEALDRCAYANAEAFVSVEDVAPPRAFKDGKLTPVRPADLIRTGFAVGLVVALVKAVTGAAPEMIPPNKHGHRPLSSYPRDLVTPGEVSTRTRCGTWDETAGQSAMVRHARSAWDVAGSAIQGAGLFGAVR